MNKIKINSLSKNFFTLRRGKVKAIRNINFEIEAGSFFVLLGPSGCGKSTLLNIIAGIEQQSTGEIYFNEKLIASPDKKVFLSPKERDVAMVFQSYALYPHMTVFENIAFPLKISRLNKEEIKRMVKEASEVLELEDLLEAKPKELSGGQRQRVALGRAIVRSPSVLLLDEPLSNLDAMLRINMRSELKTLQRKLNITTIYVTHDQLEAMSLGDKIAVIKDGEIQQIGNPDQIYNDPQNLFVARFLGSPPINIFNGRFFEKISINQASMISQKSFLAGIRPEQMKITEKDKGLFNAKIKLTSSLGSEKIIYLSTIDREFVVKVSYEKSLLEGKEVGIDFDMAKVFLFDPDSQKRISA
jgi:multiple sugar transport system ATP-binding protein